METRVQLINNEPLVGAGLHAVLDSESALAVVREDDQISTAVEGLAGAAPDVVVIGARHVRDELFVAIEALTRQFTEPSVLLMTPATDPYTVLRSFAAGARGYLSTPVPTCLIVQGIRTLAAGGMLVDKVGADVFALLAPLVHDELVLRRLTERERHVLDSLAAGRSNEEIAAEMVVATATVKKHISGLLCKLGVRDRLQAGLMGWKLGLGRRDLPHAGFSSEANDRQPDSRSSVPGQRSPGLFAVQRTGGGAASGFTG